MEELQPEELEELVQDLEGESQEEEALSPEVEELLRDLQPDNVSVIRQRAVEDLGRLGTSHQRIVSALVAVQAFDKNDFIRTLAAQSLRAPVHQEILQEHPDLMQRARSTAEQAAIQRQRQREEQGERQREKQKALQAREDRKKPMSGGATLILIVVGVFWLVLLAIGSGLLYRGFDEASDARRIANYPVLTGPGFEAMAPGEYAVVVGVLEGNAVLEYELVAFAREQWDVEADDRRGPSGSWHDLETRMPGLAVSLDDDIVHTAGRDSGVDMEGKRHEVIYQRSRSDQEADGISEGSLRVIGYKNGDLVTLVGEKDANGTLIPEILYGGELAQLLGARRGNARFAILVGGGFLIALILFTRLAVRLYAGLAEGDIKIDWTGEGWEYD